MNILLLGSGGREHALAHKLSASSGCTKLYIAPGNGGTSSCGENVDIGVNDFETQKDFCIQNEIEMVVVGPEDPLVNGVVDYYRSNAELAHIAVIGPSKNGAQLEGSKAFSKHFMDRHNIPTAKYAEFTADNLDEGKAYIESMAPPVVLKADGLAAGKGVLIIDDIEAAKRALDEMITEQQFGEASSKVVIESFMKGIEFSVFVLTDGKNYLILPSAKDYKRIGEGDTGLNTGGMGAVSPVPFVTDELMEKVKNRVIEPTVKGLAKDSISYKGFLYFGLMNIGGDPFVVEYNARMGDPETEVVLPRIDNDFVELFDAVANENLNRITLQVNPQACVTVVVASGGYPEKYEKGKEIIGLENVAESIVYHAGTDKKDGKLLTNGGRVMAISSFGTNYQEALSKSYQSIKQICFEGIYFRKDIGFDLS